MDPLPDLRARDLGGRGILHQVVDRNGAEPAQPRLDIADRHRHVRVDAGGRDRQSDVHVDELGCLDVHLGALAVDLVRALAEHRVELRAGHRDEIGVGDPRAVEAVAGLAFLVGRHLLERLRRDLGVAPVRDERAHAADREGAALVAGLDEQLGVSAHERHRHRHLAAVGQDEPGAAAAVVLDHREDVVPPAGVQARDVVAQLEEDLVHLERRGQRLDQHGRPDRAVRDADVLLAEGEDVVPQLRLFGRLDLRQVEVRADAVLDQALRVVEEVQAVVDERAGCRERAPRAVGEAHVVLGQVPAARSHHDRRRLLGGHLVDLALGGGVRQLAADRVVERQLALDDVLPGGARGVFLVGEPHLRARVERVDGHLGVGRAGDLDAAVFEAGAGTGDAPVGVVADVRRVGTELRVVPVADLEPAAQPIGEPVVPAPGEAGVQLAEEGERVGGEDLLVPLADRTRDDDRRGRDRPGRRASGLIRRGARGGRSHGLAFRVGCLAVGKRCANRAAVAGDTTLGEDSAPQ